MRSSYTLAAALSASLLATSAPAQDSGSCEALLRNFDAHLSANGIAESDERVAQARTQAKQACMAGDETAAQTSLDRAVANLGLPPVSGQAAGGDTGLTESEAPASQAGSQDQGTGQAAEGATTGGANATGGAGQQSGAGQAADMQSGAQDAGATADGQSADAQSGDQNADQNAGATTGGQSADAQAGEEGSEAGNTDQSDASGTDTGGNEAGTQ